MKYIQDDIVKLNIPQSDKPFNYYVDRENSDERYIIISIDNSNNVDTIDKMNDMANRVTEISKYLKENDVGHKFIQGKYNGVEELSLIFNSRNVDEISRIRKYFDAQESILYLWPFYIGVKNYGLHVRPVSFISLKEGNERLDVGYIKAVNKNDIGDGDYSFVDNTYFAIFREDHTTIN